MKRSQHALYGSSACFLWSFCFIGKSIASFKKCSLALIIIIVWATSQHSSRTNAQYYLSVIVSVISKVFKTACNFNGFLIIACSAPLRAIRFEKDKLNLNTLHKLNSHNTVANKRTILNLNPKYQN